MAVIEQAKILQLLRSDVKPTKKDAIDALNGVISAFGTKNFDGAPLVVRYQDGDEVKSLFVIFHKIAADKTGYTVFDNSSEAEAALQEVKDAIGADDKSEIKNELSGTTYANEGATDNGETLVDAIKALDNAIVANKVASADGTVVVTPAATGTDLSVNIDGLTISAATNGVISTAVKIKYVGAVPATEDTEAVPAHIALMDNANTELSTVAVSDLIGNGVLDHSSYNANTGMLSLFFKQADGTTKEEKIDLHEMLDINDMMVKADSTDYLKVELDGTASESGKSQAVFSVLKGTVAKPGITEEEAAAENAKHLIEDKSGKKPGEEGYTPTYPTDYTPVEAVAPVPATTGLATSEDVSEAIEDYVEKLEAEIEKLEAESLTGVTVNGHLATPTTPGKKTDVAVEIKGSDIEVASAYTTVEFAEDFSAKLGENATVAADDKVSAAFAKVENEVKVLVDEVLDNEEVTEKAIEALAEAAGLLDADGVISYVAHTGDTILSAATSLDSADVALAEAIRKVEAKSSTVVDAAANNSATLGAYVTSDIDAETKATTYHVDVNYDFGSFTL